MEAGYELFDHTADLGLKIWAQSRVDLVPQAARALYACIGELSAAGNPRHDTVQCVGAEPSVLLRDFLNELLILFERDQRMVEQFVVKSFTDSRLEVGLETVEIDRDSSVLQREVKAITYHELALNQTPHGYEAILIVDI